MAAFYQLALIVRNADPENEDYELLLTPQRRPTPPEAQELWDTELCDLPAAALSPLKAPHASPLLGGEDDQISNVVRLVHTSLHSIGLRGFDVGEAVSKIVSLTSPAVLVRPWRLWKLVEEPDFGPAPPLHTIVFMTDVHPVPDLLRGGAVWMDSCSAMDLLIDASTQVMRIGKLATHAFSPHFPEGLSLRFPLRVPGQDYPPGFLVLPMDSCTIRPFSKTNLVVFAPTVALGDESDASLAAATGGALIVDPGCSGHVRGLLRDIVANLQGRLLVFLTHHHFDHTAGLSALKDREVVLLAHQATFRRMGAAVNNFTCVAVNGGSKLNVAGQELEVISAPGHTDGHLALFHRSTGCLVAGDHCVGQGSSVLDVNSGGNMKDYLETTRRFLALHPKIIVPAHGRPNFWPMHMLNDYIKHRMSREAKILKTIEGGAQTAFEIVSQVYSDTSPTLWAAALSNVKLHVEHLDFWKKLPPGFSIKKFQQSCGTNFLVRCIPAVTGRVICKPLVQMTKAPLTNGVSVMVLVGACAVLLSRKGHSVYV